MVYDLKTPDPYSIALLEAFDNESRKYLKKLSNEDLVKLQASNFNSWAYFGRIDVVSHDALENSYKSKFFSVLANNISNLYHECTLEGKTVDMRFDEIRDYLSNLTIRATQIQMRYGQSLNSRTLGIYDSLEERELQYYYWTASLDKKLLIQTTNMVRIVKYKVDSRLSQANIQNTPTNNSSSDCFVVTATFGTPYAREVVKYRYFRDNYLSNYLLGRILIKFYNIIGPLLAKLVRKNLRLRLFMAEVLSLFSRILPEIE